MSTMRNGVLGATLALSLAACGAADVDVDSSGIDFADTDRDATELASAADRLVEAPIGPRYTAAEMDEYFGTETSPENRAIIDAYNSRPRPEIKW